jgi:hypothetical protein
MNRYNVLTWDHEKETFTPQVGLSVPSQGITLGQVRAVMAELRVMGYECRRKRHGDYEINDPSVLVERAKVTELF